MGYLASIKKMRSTQFLIEPDELNAWLSPFKPVIVQTNRAVPGSHRITLDALVHAYEAHLSGEITSLASAVRSALCCRMLATEEVVIKRPDNTRGWFVVELMEAPAYLEPLTEHAWSDEGVAVPLIPTTEIAYSGIAAFTPRYEWQDTQACESAELHRQLVAALRAFTKTARVSIKRNPIAGKHPPWRELRIRVSPRGRERLRAIVSAHPDLMRPVSRLSPGRRTGRS